MRVLTENFYPASLARIRSFERSPLWYLGDPSLLSKPLAAIVGTREVSAEGIRNTSRLSAILTKAGFGVVSGLAKGVDRAAHESALSCGGLTVAVMGTPIEQCYPREHRELKEEISEHGLVISQFKPGSPVHRSNFPKRNELMAQLCEVTFVVEASLDSGTKHQVKAATRCGHKVGFLRAVWEKKYPWVIEAVEAGSGHYVETFRDAFELLRSTNPKAAPDDLSAQELPLLTEPTTTGAVYSEDQASFAFEVSRSEPKKKPPRAPRKRAPKKPDDELPGLKE